MWKQGKVLCRDKVRCKSFFRTGISVMGLLTSISMSLVVQDSYVLLFFLSLALVFLGSEPVFIGVLLSFLSCVTYSAFLHSMTPAQEGALWLNREVAIVYFVKLTFEYVFLFLVAATAARFQSKTDGFDSLISLIIRASVGYGVLILCVVSMMLNARALDSVYKFIFNLNFLL
jgi:hypothetical protein